MIMSETGRWFKSAILGKVIGYEKPYFNIQKIHRFIVTVRRSTATGNTSSRSILHRWHSFSMKGLCTLIVTITFATIGAADSVRICDSRGDRLCN